MSPSHHTIHPRPGGAAQAPHGTRAAVVGGGIAGVAAAVVLAERGLDVTLIEREEYLGGRAGAWTDHLSDGTPFEMERGFHAFFRQYYNLQALLRRVDPELDFLEPLDDYPIHGPDGEEQSFHGLPTSTPANLATLVRRSSAINLRELTRVSVPRALEMLTYDRDRTYGRRDGDDAGAYLDSLNFPPKARRLFFDVFAHSFFNPEREMSAGELLMMFHFYFTGNPEGLVFDVSRRPFSHALWDPFAEHLTEIGVELQMGVSAESVERPGARWSVRTDRSEVTADVVVLALPVPALQDVVGASPALDDEAWRTSISELALTNPFVVWRLWLGTPTEPGRAPFIGTTGLGPLDNISLYHLFEDESRDWAEAHGGSVVELHAYAVDPDVPEAEMRASLLSGLHHLYPETRDATVLEERYLVRQDCPAFAPGSFANRPTVETPFAEIALAGDLVRLPFPSALMERAAASGFLAANHVLAAYGVRTEPVRTVPPRGLLAWLPGGKG
ncbi:MAG: FAD-dependent oxidoreductase [Gemmatimonadota bacterium]